MIDTLFDLITQLVYYLPIVALSAGSQSSEGKGASFSEGVSRGESTGGSTFASEATSGSRGIAESESLGTSASQGTSSGAGFGFSGLAPAQSAALSTRAYPYITDTVFPIAQRAGESRFNYPTLGPTGLYAPQLEAARELVRTGVSGLSSDAAARGYLSPANVEGIAGSAVSRALPQLMPVISQNIEAQATAPVRESQAQADAVTKALSSLPGFLGSQQQSQQQSQQTSDALNTAKSFSNQVSESVSKSLAESFSKSLSEAFSKSMSDWSSSSFGFNAGILSA